MTSTRPTAAARHPDARRRRVAALLLTAVAVAGCGAGPGDSAEPSAAGATTAAAPATATVSLPDTSVTLTDPGAEPRSRLVLGLGANQQVSLTATAGVVQYAGEAPAADLSSPAVTLPLTATPRPGTGTAASGGAPLTVVDVVVGRPTSPDGTLNDALGAAEGFTATLDERSVAAIGTLTLSPPANSDDTSRAAVEQAIRQALQLWVVLPVEEVGVGARWTTSTRTESLGLPLRQDVTATLESVSGPIVELAVTLSQTPLQNTWTLPDGGGVLSVDSYPMQGTGTLTLDLRRPLPVAGDLQLAGRQVYTRASDGLVIRQDVVNQVSWAP